MKRRLSRIGLMLFASAMMEAKYNNKHFDTGNRESIKPVDQKKYNYSLPEWKVGDHTIFARNEKEAIKYAKKRGLYQEGIQIEQIK